MNRNLAEVRQFGLGNSVVMEERQFISKPTVCKALFPSTPQNPRGRFSAPQIGLLQLHALGCFSSQLPEAPKFQVRVVAATLASASLLQPTVARHGVGQQLSRQVPQLSWSASPSRPPLSTGAGS